jgi:hypothetical protein
VRRRAELRSNAAEPSLNCFFFVPSVVQRVSPKADIIGLLTGHKSRELRRYQHLREELKRKTVDLIAGVLKEAGKGAKKASSSRLLHAGQKKPKPRKLSD